MTGRTPVDPWADGLFYALLILLIYGSCHFGEHLGGGYVARPAATEVQQPQ